MANSKKNDTKKIMDVAHPNTSPAPSSARPVIVTNRPIMKDPTVVEDTPSTPIQVKTTGEKKIEPLSAPELPIEEAEAQIDKHKAESAKKEGEEESPEPETEETKEKAMQEAAPADEEVAEKQDNTPAIAEEPGDEKEGENVGPEAQEESVTAQEDAPKEEEAEPQPEATPPAKEPEPEVKAQDTEENSEKEAAPGDSPEAETAPLGNSTEDKDKLSTVSGANEVKDAEKIEAEEAAKKAEHDEKIQKIVESKQYYLPINSVEKRKSRRFVSLGILLSLLLVVAWADIALDAGLINISTNLPHTHFFSTNASSTVSSPTAPVAIPTPSSPADKQAASQLSTIQKLLANYASLNHSYPSDISQSTLQPELDSTSTQASVLTPPNGTKFVYTVFPSTCTTQAGNCSRYLLKAETKGGNVISSLHQ